MLLSVAKFGTLVVCTLLCDTEALNSNTFVRLINSIIYYILRFNDTPSNTSTLGYTFKYILYIIR